MHHNLKNNAAMPKDKICFDTDYDLLCFYKDLYGDLIYRTGIYKIYFTERPEYFYIGMASRCNKNLCYCGFYNRWKRHLRDLKNNIHANTFKIGRAHV